MVAVLRGIVVLVLHRMSTNVCRAKSETELWKDNMWKQEHKLQYSFMSTRGN